MKSIYCFIQKSRDGNYVITSSRSLENYTLVTCKEIKKQFLLFDGEMYSHMLGDHFQKYLRNGDIPLKHLPEDLIFIKYYNSHICSSIYLPMPHEVLGRSPPESPKPVSHKPVSHEQCFDNADFFTTLENSLKC
jgi:hypothetical protein